MLQRFLDYMAEFDPSYSHRIRGVTEEDIRRLANLFGRPLPASYVSFLRTMGADHGGVVLAGNARSDYESVYAYVSEVLEEMGPEGIPEGCLIIGKRLFPGIDLCLEVDREGEPGVVAADEEILFPLADSLLNLLMCDVFIAKAIPALGHVRRWGGFALEDRGKAPALARELGFVPHWFSDSYNWCGEQPGLRIYLWQVPTEPLGVFLAARDQSDLDRLGARIESELGVSTANVVEARTPEG